MRNAKLLASFTSPSHNWRLLQAPPL